MAGPSIKFLGRAPDEDVEYHVSRCRALLFPGEEDFGMAPLEVAAAGRPTVAYRAGGAVETIIENVTGAFFERQTAEDLGDAIERFERQEWRPDVIRRHSETFSIQVFRDRFRCFFRRIGTPVDIPDSEKVDSLVDAFERRAS
jgi:glycosyltransferase involved in cell wall biosynthesis